MDGRRHHAGGHPLFQGGQERFGDLVPTSEASRLFTAPYALVGVGIIGTAMHLVISNARAVGQARDAAESATELE